jgi:L-threonylcarbamoyladenylate synthase
LNTLDEALAALADGRVVAAATESAFGLLVDASRPDALDVLLALKVRGTDKGLPLILPDRESWSKLAVEIPEPAARLANAFWPGPLTIALPAAAEVDPRITLGDSVAVRLPALSPAAEIARRFGRPLTATSANRPGAPAAVSSDEVRAAFLDAVREARMVVVEGQAPGGSPSTVVVIEDGRHRILRVGPISVRKIERVLRG